MWSRFDYPLNVLPWEDRIDDHHSWKHLQGRNPFSSEHLLNASSLKGPSECLQSRFEEWNGCHFRCFTCLAAYDQTRDSFDGCLDH